MKLHKRYLHAKVLAMTHLLKKDFFIVKMENSSFVLLSICTKKKEKANLHIWRKKLVTMYNWLGGDIYSETRIFVIFYKEIHFDLNV